MNGARTFFRRSATALIAALTFGLFAPAISSAASASPATYRVSRHAVSTSANHEVQFVTPTGVDASTDTIVLSGYTGFDLSAIIVGDVDLFHGPVTGLETSEALAALPGVGTWGVSIGATSVTFTAPSDAAAGEISPGDLVVIRIGTNASGGANQIVHPATDGLAQISLGGTFGDAALMGVPIIDNDQVTVSAQVATSAPPVPPGGGGGSGDIVPPDISNVQVINITTSSATIIWNTNESADSSVDYGLTTSYASGTVFIGGLVTSHSIDLVNLSPATLYHFQVSSRDVSSNLATAGDFTFTTLGDVVPPVISNIQVVDITDVSARVIWTTNELADSFVGYGTTTLYGLTLGDPGFVTSHSVVLTGLTPNTLYHFFVQSTDQSANTATSTDGTFVTLPDSTPPANVLGFSAIGGDAVVHLSWQAPPDPDYAGVRIVRRMDGYPTGPFDGTVVYVGAGTFTDDTQVINGVTYYYGAFAFDSNANYASGALAQATPVAPIFPENTTAACSNGVDDDLDGQIDCADAECSALPVCVPPPPTPENTNATCSNGVDDDLDGQIDCADAGCVGVLVCAPPVVPPPPVVVLPPPLVPQPIPSGEIIAISAHFFGSQGTIELVQNAQHQFGAPANSTIFLTVPIVGIQAMPEQAFLVVGGPGGSMYQLSLNQDGTAYVTTFAVVDGQEIVPLTVSMTFQGGGASVSEYALVIQSGGRVVEQGLLDAVPIPVPNATVSLFVDQGGSWVLWNGAPYSQSNPTLSSADGGFLFIVPNGRYFVSVQKDGYLTASSPPIVVTRNVFGATVAMIPIPPTPPEVISPTSTIIENIANLAENAIQQASFGAAIIRAFLDQPQIQQSVENVAAPTLLIVGLLNLATALPIFNIFAYLQYLFTQPILLFWRRRRKKFGTVYNSLTKQPIDLAIVRLLHAQTRTIVQTRVTDRSGRFAFLVNAGSYVIDVVKPGYVFPSQHLKDQRSDVDFLDLYHGLLLHAEKRDAIAVNIPMDPVVPVEPTWQVVFKKFLRRLQVDMAFVSVLLAMVALIISPTIQIALIVLVQVGAFLLFQRLSQRGKAKQWGIVYDTDTRAPLPRAVVRIFDKKFNKLLETQVTDTNGKYGFFVRRNVFYVTGEREGYEKFVSPDIDLTSKDDAIVDQNVALKRKLKNS